MSALNVGNQMEPFLELSNAAIEGIIRPTVEGTLNPLGFERGDCLKWVRSADAPIRQVFTFHKWKGGLIAPSWGVSLDFVPHLVSGQVKWHRTPKSALQDLRLDAREPRLSISYVHGPSPLGQGIGEVTRLAVAEAQTFWRVSSTVAGLPASCEWAEQYYARHEGLMFDDYGQHAVARPFILAKSGRDGEARALLKQFFERNRSSLRGETAERLRALLAKCAQHRDD